MQYVSHVPCLSLIAESLAVNLCCQEHGINNKFKNDAH